MPEQRRSAKPTAIALARIAIEFIDLPTDPIGVVVKLEAKPTIKTDYGCQPVAYWIGLELPLSKS
jgi:hypothetical protein